MKLIRFGQKGAEKPAVYIDGKRWDCSPHFEDWNRDFFQQGGMQELASLLASGKKLTEVSAEERWGAPIARPGMIMCIGLNYSDHAKESGMEIPKEPIIFMKASNTLAGPFDEVIIPKNSDKTDWEVELGVILGKDIYQLANEEEAEAAIAGYCVVNDISERHFQIERGGQWTKGKSCPGFSPCGPYMLSKDETSDVNSLQMSLDVNGQRMQSGNTNKMIFNPAYSLWYLSQFMLLEAGDLISTGTPPGVGLGMNPPTYLKGGDIVELEIEGLGKQKQTFVKQPG
ncbi:MAG: fumarylacetoacetate hydrolase family protein [Bacteroidia bacterium]|nr:fumarylacetoacetate hydrolase family protein [Bacteroidia bacterium]